MVTTPPSGRNRLILVGLAIVAVAVLLVLARGALFPFVLGGALALTVPPAIRRGSELVDSLPELYSRARATLERWSGEYASGVPDEAREQIEKTLGSGGSILIRAGQSMVSRTVGGVINAFTAVIGLAIVPLFLFYLLKDREAAVGGFYSFLPAAGQRHMRNVMDITNQVLGSYVRAQLTLAAVVAIFVSLGLFLLDVRYPLLLGALPGLLVVLATSPESVWSG